MVTDKPEPQEAPKAYTMGHPTAWFLTRADGREMQACPCCWQAFRTEEAARRCAEWCWPG